MQKFYGFGRLVLLLENGTEQNKEKDIKKKSEVRLSHESEKSEW